jgi:hypothetical protein
MGLLFLILGLVWWFPIGLFILAAFLVSRAIGYWHRPQFAGAGVRPAVGGMLVGASGKVGWPIAPPACADAAPEIGETNLQAKIARSTNTAPTHCVALKTSNVSSRNSFNGCASRRIAPNWISS